MKYVNYSKTRFKWDKRRDIVWSEIARYMQRYIKKKFSVLDLGSGYCNFINNVKAKEKFALDKYINPKKYALPEINCIFGDFSLIKDKIKDNSLDVVFASNFFEHLTEKEIDECISLLNSKLKERGLLMVLQPNYKLCYKNYFDDYTHTKIWTDISLMDYLKNQGFSIKKNVPGFLPFSMKSNLPKIKLIIRLYLNSLIKPFASQMFIIAQKNG